MQELLCLHLDLPLVKSHPSTQNVSFSNFSSSRDLLLLSCFGHDYYFCCLHIYLLAKCFLVSWILWLSKGINLAPVLKCQSCAMISISNSFMLEQPSSLPGTLEQVPRHLSSSSGFTLDGRQSKDNHYSTLFYHLFSFCPLNFSLASLQHSKDLQIMCVCVKILTGSLVLS